MVERSLSTATAGQLTVETTLSTAYRQLLLESTLETIIDPYQQLTQTSI